MKKLPIWWVSATALGLCLGIVDFLSPNSFFAILGTLVGGGLVAWNVPSDPWRLSAWLGCCVPLALTVGMATGLHPARGHFVLLDARTILLALLGAFLIQRLHRSNPVATPASEDRS